MLELEQLKIQLENSNAICLKYFGKNYKSCVAIVYFSCVIPKNTHLLGIHAFIYVAGSTLSNAAGPEILCRKPSSHLYVYNYRQPGNKSYSI